MRASTAVPEPVVCDLSQGLLLEHTVRAMELDMNASLVRGFVFDHGRSAGQGPPSLLPLVIGQTESVRDASSVIVPHCTYVVTCPRDFFTLVPP